MSQRMLSAQSAPPKRATRSRGLTLKVWARNGTLTLLGVLLGHAVIAHTVSPFGLAYFAILTELVGTRRSWPAVFAVVGAYEASGLTSTLGMALSFLIYRLLRKALFRKKAPDLHWVPFIAGAVDIASRIAVIGRVWTRYDLVLAFSEGALVIILSLIFVQSMPLFIGHDRSKHLRYDQLISLTIFLGSVITGLAGLTVQGVSLVAIGVDWTVLTMAAVGGAGVGTTVAIVVGTLAMLSHSQPFAMIAVLAFSALLAGIVKEAGRFWAALSFLVSFSLLTVSINADWKAIEASIIAVFVAMLLVLLTPGRVLQSLAAYVPGTPEHQSSEQERVRRVRTLLSEKINELSMVFDELSATFADTGENPLMSAQQLLNHVVGAAANDVCHGCARRMKCWEKEGYATYQSIVNTVTKLESNSGPHVTPTIDLKERCIRIDSMMGILRHHLEISNRDAHWIEKLREQKTLVSAQLSGVANMIRTIAVEVDKGNESAISGEEQVLGALQQLGLYVDHVHIVSLDPGKVEVEITQPSHGAYENSVRVIAPLLSGITGENITVSKLVSDEPGPCTSVFSSARLFNVNTAVSTVARDGRLVSGDTYTSMDLGNGRYAIAVSDGMGNGERARRESKAAIELLNKLLKAGFDEQLAIKTVNSTLLLRSRDEMFTTLDMVLIDLFSARAEFLKIGSAPSFLKRGKTVKAISGANVPIGILQDIEVQSIEEQLRDGDILILMSDGVFDAPQQVHDKEDWLRRQIERLETKDPQEIADTLLESAVRMANGQIPDDMTVMVAVVTSFQPDWAAIKLPGVTGLREGHGKRRGA